ncbi:mitochondrial fission 1 protein-like isoform X2 [Dendronephthya gigantea]|uniref:mitochondrial fission 1 protein-like isoform X2 n=1 Tax=Dendronephthya gigantea TaxID=151771 RepID=UPI00106DBB3E|nr:mitochondrial fission 1 protein-like isoform X2 [Dendronephthya gigantea]
MEPEFNREDLERFEKKYKTEQESGHVARDTQFNYAWTLIQSPNTNDIKKGAHLLQDLCTHGIDQRDYVYFLAEANYKLSEYQIALKYINRVLDIEPNNKQAKELKEKIEQKMKRDGAIGAILVGGATVAAVGALAMMFVKRK